MKMSHRVLPLVLLSASEVGSYLLAPHPLPVSQRARSATVSPVRSGPPAMRLEEHEAAEAAEEAAFEEQLEAEGAVARSPEILAQLREAGAKRATVLASDAAVAAMLEKGAAVPTGKMAKLLKKPKGTLALIGEGVRIDVVSMGGFDLDDPAYLSGEFRAGGCTAVSVDVSERNALTSDVLEKTFAEQETVRGDFPGPLPVLVRDDFVEPAQLAAAAVGGAKMVILSLALVGTEGIGRLMAEAERLGLEVALRVTTDEEMEAAVSAGAKMVCIGGVSSAQAEALVAQVPAGVLSIADFEARDVRGIWKIRDMGFNAAIVGQGLLQVVVRDRVPPAATLKAMLSKGSVKFGLGMQKGRLEGSKENLGTIAM